MLSIRRFFSNLTKGSSAFAKIQVSFSQESRMQFFVPVNSTVEQFASSVQSQCKQPITYELDNSLKHVEGFGSFIDIAVYHNLTLKIGDKILAYEIKQYEEVYDYMPKYNSDLLEQYQKLVPIGVKAKDLLSSVKLKPAEPPLSVLSPLRSTKEMFLQWYNKQMERIGKECLWRPKLMTYLMMGQWVFLFTVTFGIYGWDTGEPLAYLSGLTVELMLFMGIAGMEQAYLKEFQKKRKQFLNKRFTDVNAYYRHLHWRTMYVQKKIDSLS